MFKILKKVNWNRVIYSFLFFVFCLTENINENSVINENRKYTFRALMVISVLAIPAMNFINSWIAEKRKLNPVSKFGMISYTSIVSLTSILLWSSWKSYAFPHEFIVWYTYLAFSVMVWLGGIVTFQTIWYICTQKSIKNLNIPILVMEILFFVLMGVGIDKTWKWWVIGPLLLLSLNPVRENLKKDFYEGMINGLIMGVLFIEALACMFRPFDNCYGYDSFFLNSNMASLFFTLMLSAFAVKIIMHKNDKIFSWKSIISFLGYAVAFDLIAFTGSRCGFLAFAAISLFICFIILIKAQESRIKALLMRIAMMILAVLITFPVVFVCVRFGPVLCPRTVYFYTEDWEKKVNYLDPWNSEKYMEFGETLDMIAGRYIRKTLGMKKYINENDEHGTISISVDQIGQKKEPRFKLWSQVLKQLNLRGYKDLGLVVKNKDNMEDTGKYYYHVHNIFLQYGHQYGFVTMLMLIFLYILTLYRHTKLAIVSKEHKIDNYIYVPLLIVFLVLGFFEYLYPIEKVAHLMLYFSLSHLIWIKDKKSA